MELWTPLPRKYAALSSWKVYRPPFSDTLFQMALFSFRRRTSSPSTSLVRTPFSRMRSVSCLVLLSLVGLARPIDADSVDPPDPADAQEMRAFLEDLFGQLRFHHHRVQHFPFFSPTQNQKNVKFVSLTLQPRVSINGGRVR